MTPLKKQSVYINAVFETNIHQYPSGTKHFKSDSGWDYHLKEQTGYFLTSEELLELIKRKCGEAFDAGEVRGKDWVNVITPEGHIHPDKETYLQSLNIE